MTTDLTHLTPKALPTRAEAAALGFLARYERATLELYRIHLRVLFDWCGAHGLDPLDVERTHLELFRHYLTTERGNAPTTVEHRLTVIRQFYRFAVIDGYLEKSPADHLNIPRAKRDESRLMGLSRHELATLLSVAQGEPRRWALVAMLGLLGMRVSEACSVDVEDTRGEQRGYRTISFVGKAGKPATMPLPVPVQRAIDAAIGDRTSGPLLLRESGTRLERRTAYRWIRRLGERAGIRDLHPHALRHTMVTLSLDAGVPLRDVQYAARHADPRMTERYDRQRGNLDRHAAHYLVAYVAGAAA